MKPPQRRAHGRWAAALMLVATTLTGCASLPVDDRVRQGQALNRDALQEPPGVAVQPPVEGSSPDDILRGFLRAMANATDDFSVARQYLTPAASSTWRPNDEPVLVYESEASMTILSSGEGSESETSRQVTVNAAAQVTAKGEYQPRNPASKENMAISLKREGSEWRISALPEHAGRWLTQSDFQRSYQTMPVHFAAWMDDVLIPDQRWVPRGDGMATTLARLQAADPPEYLRGAVRTGVPSGTKLEVNAVSVQDREATVQLEGEERAVLSAEQRDLINAQFTMTLSHSGMPIDRVKVVWRGAALDQTATAQFRPMEASTPYHVVRQGSQLGRYRIDGTRLKSYTEPPQQGRPPGERIQPLPTLPELPSGWEQVAVSSDSRVVYAVGPEGVVGSWYQGQKSGEWATPGTTTTPTMDEGGGPRYVPHTPGAWFATTPEGGAGASSVWWSNLATASAPGAPQQVPVPWLGERQIVSMRLAPDNVRMVLVLKDPAQGGFVIGVSAVLRDPVTARPVGLTPALRVAPAMDDANDIAWTGESDVTVLGRDVRGAKIRPWRVRLGGEMVKGVESPDARAITARFGEGQGGILLTDADGRSYQAVGAEGWTELAGGVEIATPGE